MRTKILLFLSLLMCGVLQAQDTIKTLVVSEVRLDDARRSYIEIANVGTDSINIGEFSVGVTGAWTTRWGTDQNLIMRLPEQKLAPQGTFILASIYDWGPEMFLLAPEDYDPFLTKREFWTLADVQLHFPESPTNSPSDSIHPKYRLGEFWGGRDCVYLRHHISATDSAVVDQVNGVFDGTDGTRSSKGAYPVAGITNATTTHTLIRKFSVKEGNIDFVTGAGQDLTESEWIPIPHQAGGRWSDNVRRLFWTAGNHGDYNLVDGTLTSDELVVDWTAKTITVPWGVRRDDSIMSRFDKTPGLAWHYDYVDSYEDSAYTSARTGDTLTVYAAGNDMDVAAFRIIVAAPAADASIVVPMKAPNADGFFEGVDDPFYTVSYGVVGMDTIGTARFGGIPYATRIDTLQKYLEKAEGASWDIVWVGGAVRTDLQEGDILRVTAPNGTTTKDYYIKVDQYRKNHNAYLGSITWPDIPADYRGTFGWIGDTIPNFVHTKYNYTVTIPYDITGVPHLLGKSQNVSAEVEVDPATSLTGSLAGKTATFTVTAEDDTTIREYAVQMILEKPDDKIQPAGLEPFFSQYTFRDQWSNNFIEIVNPGPLPLDMSNYMICAFGANSPSDAITWYGEPTTATWRNRYLKYIPGYKWVDSTTWKNTPAMLIEDPAISPIVKAGDVFVMGEAPGTGQSGYPWFASQQCDVIIDATHNPWGEPVNNQQHWWNANIYLFRIDNDSITRGLKDALNPADYTLIDVFGSGDGTRHVVGGQNIDQIHSYIRKPEIYLGNPVYKGSFGTDAATSEWIRYDRAYYDARGVPWPQDILYINEDLGSHFMEEVSIYKSTISSSVYKVSDGYSMEEAIRGVVTGTTVEDFLANLVKSDPGQALTVIDTLTLDTVDVADAVTNGNMLLVLSANLVNTSGYLIEVTDGGLSNDAVLTSEEYTIAIDGEAGTITGMAYGDLLNAIDAEIVKPVGATVLITDADGKYITFKTLNFDTMYVEVQVTDQIFYNVTAENGVDQIIYQVVPTAESDAFVTSDVFDINQETSLIDLLPSGLDGFPSITVPALLNNLVPAPGATLMVIDKLGFERTQGIVAKDDLLVVTSEDGETTKTYYLQMVGDDLAPAYVVSEVYMVDAIDYAISGDDNTITTGLSVANFKANLIPAEGAVMTVTNSQGTPKTSGNMAIGDLLVVVSSDGLTEVTYTIAVINAIDSRLESGIVAYPNPSKGKYTISGSKAGNRVQVTNITGALVLEKYAARDNDEVSIENERSGIYFITVSDKTEVIGRYKVIKE